MERDYSLPFVRNFGIIAHKDARIDIGLPILLRTHGSQRSAESVGAALLHGKTGVFPTPFLASMWAFVK
ncbi:MAG: hypothetical protein COV70_04040 [Parcubacteria group bacterium CG11_big_fil_rev_8_21_14_0_20_39_22]|nr:MAG: hypothetical protein COV70_04040 [Parcubacteria group bacterium CG11_big_fil_rev_8_21_14_0_20_39_22]